MEKSPSWWGDSGLATQQIPRILWSKKFRIRVHKSLPTVSNVRKIISFCNLTYDFPMIRF
jgi:hypothetical protein